MKKLLASILSIIFLLSLAACGSDKSSEETKSSKDTTKSEDVSETFKYDEDYVSKHLGDHYSITYNFTYYEKGTKTKTSTMSLMKNEKGYYYNLGDDSEFLYIKEGDSYVMCTKDESGVFKKMEGVTISEEDVKASAEALVNYTSFYYDYRDDLKKDGSEKVSGRDCYKYKMKSATIGASIKIEYYIDKETGVCMKYKVYATGAEKGGFDYECTQFSLDDVTLPSYQ